MQALAAGQLSCGTEDEWGKHGGLVSEEHQSERGSGVAKSNDEPPKYRRPAYTPQKNYVSNS